MKTIIYGAWPREFAVFALKTSGNVQAVIFLMIEAFLTHVMVN